MKQRTSINPFYITEEKMFWSKKMRQNPTPHEEILWAQLRNRQRKGNTFIRQKVILGWIIDFYCHKRRLAIEVDGAQHHQEKDRVRDKNLNKIGIYVMRIRNEEVENNLDKVIERIDRMLVQQE